MKRLSLGVLASLVLASAAPPLLAETPAHARGPRVVTRGPASKDKAVPKPGPATSASYSVQVNIVTRVQGTSFFRTAIDITNNTDVDGVTAILQYCYRFNGVFQCTAQEPLTLLSFDNFHTDDIIEHLDALGLLLPGAGEFSFGTLLVTFDGLPSGVGWEGTVTARTYSPVNQSNPSAGTVAIAYPGSLFFESAEGSLVGTIRDTRPAPTAAGALRTNIGVTNTDIFGVGNVDVQLSFYNVTPGTEHNGERVGNILTVNGLAPGEVRQIVDAFTAALIPLEVDSCIVFIDVIGGAAGATIEGYINILDGGTQDGAYFEMKCAFGCAQ